MKRVYSGIGVFNYKKIDVLCDDLATLQLIVYEVRKQRSSVRINKEYSGVKSAIVMNPKDNVATALSDLRCGGTLTDLSVGGNKLTVKLIADIPFSHKFSLYEIKANCPIIKYGETMGIATTDITTGDYVHTHNVKSARVRSEL